MSGRPESPEELVARALSLRRQGDFHAAREAARRAIRAREDHPSAWFNLGAACAGLGDAEAAEAAYRKALSLHPGFAEAWSNLAGLLALLGRQDEALSAYRQALAANERLAPIWSNFGNALVAAGEHAEAERALQKALALDAGFVPAWVNLGRVLHESRRFEEAHAACERALELAPESAGAWAGLANALMGLRRFGAAVDAFANAVRLEAGNPDFHANLAVALWRMERDDAAMSSVRRALQLDPAHAFASFHLSDWLLERGEYGEGWRYYESRWRRAGAQPRRYVAKGGEPRGRVLIWGEQGVGDEILHSILAGELAAKGAEVTLEADERLAPLFHRSFPAIRVWPRRPTPDLDPGRFDSVLPAGSLGQWLRRSGDAFPKQAGYLVPEAARARAYRASLPADTFVVGIAWRSSNPELGAEKSSRLAEWQPLLAVPGVTFVNLQYGATEAECDEAERRCRTRIVRIVGLDLYRDLDGLAALQAACDLVITTSNVNAHITGALGRPGWVLLPRRLGRFWYWSQAGAATPWYPSLRLLAQETDGDWASVIGPAAKRLRRMLAHES